MGSNDLTMLLQAAVDRARVRDPALADELDARRGEKAAAERVEALASSLSELTDDPLELARAAYDYRIVHPVFTVRDSALGPSRPHVESRVWRSRLEGAGEKLLRAIRAVGRIEVVGHPDYAWVGTGFVVGRDLIATNAHVADEFADPDGRRFPFAVVFGPPMEVSIDFMEEDGRTASFVVPVEEVRYMASKPDLALLRVDRRRAKDLPEPLTLAPAPPRPGQWVAAVGYPWHETRHRHAEGIRAIFGDVFDKKRVAPGEIGEPRGGHVIHHCSVLGGNSGSPLVDLATGHVVGVHHTGEFAGAGEAVPPDEAGALLARVEAGDLPEPAETLKADGPRFAREHLVVASPPADAGGAGGAEGPVVRIDMPIHLEITVQAPSPRGE